MSGKTDEAGTESYSYGDLDEPVQKTVTYVGLSGKSIGYAYFPNGSLKTTTTPAGSFSYLYDVAGRVVSLTNPFLETTGYTYLNNNWLSAQTLPNGVGSSFSYNTLGQITALNSVLGGSTLTAFTGMTYDGAGNRLGVTASVPGFTGLSGSTSYTYDAKNQVTQEASTRASGFTNNYGYDAVGNPTTFKGQSRTYNAKNQITGGTGLAGSFAYDNDGNPTTYNGNAVTFNIRNCPTDFGCVLTAGYDSSGLRVWKQKGALGDRTYFLYDGISLVCELDASGNVTATNTWGPNGLVSRRTGTSSVFYTFDERGNTVQRLDALGNVLSNHLNDAFGSSVTVGLEGRRIDPYDGFGGQYGYYRDKETGLILCTFRYYHPSTGRWINRDPIGYNGGTNLYSYVLGNPVMGIDPSGLKISPNEVYKHINMSKCSDKEAVTVRWAIGQMLTTPRGQEIAQRFKDPKFIITVIPNKTGFDQGDPNTSILHIDFDKHLPTKTTIGYVGASNLRTIVHEMGHLLTGVSDGTEVSLINIRLNENPIMTALGYAPRIQYNAFPTVFDRILPDRPIKKVRPK